MRAKQKDGNINNGAPDNLEMLVPDFTRLTMENASDCIYWVDPAGNFVYVNKTAIQLLGYAKTEFLNMSVGDIDPDFNTQNWKKFWEKLRTQTKVVMDVINKAKNGRTIHFEVAANYIRVGQKEYNCAFAHEITERRQTQEALQRELEVKSALADLYSPLVSPVTPFHEIAYTVLEHAEKLTHSPHGCVSIIDPDSERYIGYTQIKLPPQQYRHSEDGKGIIFTNKKNGSYKGLWGHSLNTKRAFYTNTPSHIPAAKSTAGDCPPAQRFLTVPVLLGKELVGRVFRG